MNRGYCHCNLYIITTTGGRLGRSTCRFTILEKMCMLLKEGCHGKHERKSLRNHLISSTRKVQNKRKSTKTSTSFYKKVFTPYNHTDERPISRQEAEKLHFSRMNRTFSAKGMPRRCIHGQPQCYACTFADSPCTGADSSRDRAWAPAIRYGLPHRDRFAPGR